MSDEFMDNRIDDTTLGSQIDDRMRALEAALTYFLGISGAELNTPLTGQLLDADVDGHITNMVRFYGPAGTVGVRWRDSGSGDELALAIEGASLKFYRNDGDEATPVWTEINAMDLATGLLDVGSSSGGNIEAFYFVNTGTPSFTNETAKDITITRDLTNGTPACVGESGGHLRVSTAGLYQITLLLNVFLNSSTSVERWFALYLERSEDGGSTWTSTMLNNVAAFHYKKDSTQPAADSRVVHVIQDMNVTDLVRVRLEWQGGDTTTPLYVSALLTGALLRT